MKIIFPFLLLCIICTNCFSQQNTLLHAALPDEFGISEEGLSRTDSLLLKYIIEKKLQGMVIMISRHGKIVANKSYGLMNEDKPMQLNTLFRIASMTKPITAAAVMILYDEGYFHLDDPVSDYIPGLKNLEVFVSRDKDGTIHTKNARPVTIRNLLMHTSGLSGGFEDNPVDSMYRAANLSNGTLKDMVQKLANIPLLYQPGSRWNYSRSSDVLAYLVEVISGMPFDEFLQEKIFTPLQMEDTGYSVPVEKLNRVSSVYSISDSGKIVILSAPEINNVSEKVKFLSGNGGLISTAKDYMAFLQMLLNKGEFNGRRILKESTVQLMISNQITSEIMPSDNFFGSIMSGMGFGFGFAVSKGNKPGLTSPAGSFWWSGSANTYFYVDPGKDIALLLMTQFVPNYYHPVFEEFKESVYKSIK
jgi:CubicO group peptidase (beta-lactamase class C family)